MKSIRIIKMLGLISAAMIFFGACDDDPPPPPAQNEQEVISMVKLVLTPQGAGSVINYHWSDSDGVGGKPPVFDTLRLQQGKTYDAEIHLYNVSKKPSDTLTDDILAEANVHQFFYKVLGLANNTVTISRLDTDNNGLPLGMQIRIVTGTPSAGGINVKLYHYDGVVKTANPSTETDLDVTVPLKVE